MNYYFVDFENVRTDGTKNALDFQPSSYLGYRICNGNDSSLYYIVSNDKGFYRFTYHFQKILFHTVSKINMQIKYLQIYCCKNTFEIEK